MKKGNKIQLADLKVSSFVTNDQKADIKGGAGTTCLCCPCTCCCKAEEPNF